MIIGCNHSVQIQNQRQTMVGSLSMKETSELETKRKLRRREESGSLTVNLLSSSLFKFSISFFALSPWNKPLQCLLSRLCFCLIHNLWISNFVDEFEFAESARNEEVCSLYHAGNMNVTLWMERSWILCTYGHAKSGSNICLLNCSTEDCQLCTVHIAHLEPFIDLGF